METFLSGLKAYFAEHQWRNTTLEDFIGAMQLAYEPGSDSLGEFSSSWLKSKGVNSFTLGEAEDGNSFVLT